MTLDQPPKPTSRKSAKNPNFGEVLKFGKPIKLVSDAIRKSANGEDCTICGRNNGTTVYCHLPLRGAGFGGVSSKVMDLLGYYGCSDCHRTETETGWLELLIGHSKTLEKLYINGIIEVKL